MKRISNKFIDGKTDFSQGSRADRYWSREGLKAEFSKLRKPSIGKLSRVYSEQDVFEMLQNDFGIKGVEFGNWVKNQDRFNHLVATYIALHDINVITKLGVDTGGRKLGICIGSRGYGGQSAAHYSPYYQIININRHSRGYAVAHEYGHHLDYYFGTYYDKSCDDVALSGGRIEATTLNTRPQDLRRKGIKGAMNRVIHAIIFNGKGEYTQYYQALKKEYIDGYWIRRNELFARAFEQYVCYKLKKRKIQNKYLTKTKYDAKDYMDEQLLKKVVPLIDQLLAAIRKSVKVG
jgi:Large polyvalent protein-associated domain 1